eukprot:1193185-Amorphochlora_amoeboformis.AAC.3
MCTGHFVELYARRRDDAKPMLYTYRRYKPMNAAKPPQPVGRIEGISIIPRFDRVKAARAWVLQATQSLR